MFRGIYLDPYLFSLFLFSSPFLKSQYHGPQGLRKPVGHVRSAQAVHPTLVLEHAPTRSVVGVKFHPNATMHSYSISESSFLLPSV